MRFFYTLLSIIFLFCVFLHAEVVQSVRIHDMTYMSESLAKDIINIKDGENLNNEKIDKAVLELYKQGYFSDIYVTFENGILHFYVTEKPAVASVEIKGYGTQSEKDTIYGQLGIKKGDTYDDMKLEKALEILKQMLEYYLNKDMIYIYRLKYRKARDNEIGD